ncbi:hypothetical protein LEMLEM_LOCUS17149, partial [Lemmus lemmus]
RSFPSTTPTPGHTRLLAGTLVTLPASQKPCRRPCQRRGPRALRKMATARWRPTTDRPTDRPTSLAHSGRGRLHLLWRYRASYPHPPFSRPEVTRAHNRAGNSPVVPPLPPEHGERGLDIRD